MEDVKQNMEPVNEPESGAGVAPKPEPEDLLSRVANFVEEKKPEGKSEDEIDGEVFNDAEFRRKIDAITDPELKDQMIRLRKSAISGVGQKFQEIAEIRKELQSLKERAVTQGNKWSAEKIQEMINDPEFIKAAQSVVGNDNTDDEYIPESVKAQLRELADIKTKVGSWEEQMTRSQMEQAHQVLTSKYGADYDKNQIDSIHKSVLEGKVKPSFEDYYKAINYEKNVRRAYELGIKDARKGVEEKSEISSMDGIGQQPNQQLKPEVGESDKNFFKKIIQKNLQMAKR
jgi:hypothetical protein